MNSFKIILSIIFFTFFPFLIVQCTLCICCLLLSTSYGEIKIFNIFKLTASNYKLSE